jgi:hypothetical protein
MVSNYLMDLVIFMVMAKKIAIAISKQAQKAPNMMRECITLRRLFS